MIITPFAWSSKMASSINEATYLFELKGEFEEAISLLEKISVEGDDEDKAEAYFLLGKIHDLSKNFQSAIFNYTQALISPMTDAQAYWIAERLAYLDRSPERLIKANVKTKAPIVKIFGGNNPTLLLNNNQLLQLHGDKFVSVPTVLPENTIIHAISNTGIWFSEPDKFVLHFQPKQAKKPTKNYAIDSQVSTLLPLSGNQALVMTEKTLLYVSNEGIRFSIENRYKGCTPLGIFSPTNQFVLNCPDNALHLLQADDGTDHTVLSQIDAIDKVIISQEGILLTSGNSSWYYKPHRQTAPLWKYTGNTIEDVTLFGNRFAILESVGMLKLLNPETGNVISRLQTDAERLFPVARGELGVFTQEGAMTVVDTLLVPLWKYHFGQNLLYDPISGPGLLFLPLADGSIKVISSLYYGKKNLLTNQFAQQASSLAANGAWTSVAPLLDSLRHLEPGNATAWYLMALMRERNNAPENVKQKTWAEAVRFSIGDSKASASSLFHYSKAIGARYVRFLNMSPRTLYPHFFGNDKNLFTVDPAAQTLLNINPETGEIRWIKNLGNLENSPVMANNATTLAIASGFHVTISDLTRDSHSTSLELPGKPFQIQFSEDAIFISTWNGFLIKLLQPNYNLAWSRKIFTIPFHFSVNQKSIFLASLDGELLHVGNVSGQVQKHGPNLHTSITALQSADSLLAVASEEDEITIYSNTINYQELQKINTKSSILSMQWVYNGATKNLLVSLANQQIKMFRLGSDDPIWTYQGNGSIFATPVIYKSLAWIDQGNSIVGLSLSKGTVEKRFSTPKGAGTPFILNNTLFSASPKRLLYAFPLRK